MCDNIPMPKVGVFCCQRTCRWKGLRHPYTAYAKPCPRCGGRLIGDDEYYRAQRAERFALMEAAATKLEAVR